MNEYFIKQLEAYDRTLGRPAPRRRFAMIASRCAGFFLTYATVIVFVVFLSLLANPLAHLVTASAYRLYLERAPVDLVAMASEEEAVWLREIRKTPCIAYEANTWAEHAIFGRVLTLAHSEYKKCWDHLKRPTL